MKKHLIAIFLVLLVMPFAASRPLVKAFKIPANAIRISDDVYDLGKATLNGEELQGYLFVHYKKGYARNSAAVGGSTKCYAFLSSGAKWKATEQYVLDTSNIDNMSDSFVASVTQASLDTWDFQVAFQIFGPRDTSSVVDGVDTAAPDNKNEIMFGSISEPGVIGVTTVWGIFGGNPRNRKLVEFDAVFDDVDFAWGDATIDPSLMDYRNIAVHEFGHAAGMDHPASTCTEETMYAYASEGETKKRDLNTGDIAGIKKLYK